MIPVKDLTDLCFDINECSDEPCNDLEYCMNMIGSYECQCLEGYKYNEVQQCEDINECEEDLLACGSNNICKNNLGQNLNPIFRHEFFMTLDFGPESVGLARRCVCGGPPYPGSQMCSILEKDHMSVLVNQDLSLLVLIVVISMNVCLRLVTNSHFAQIFRVRSNANVNLDILVME